MKFRCTAKATWGAFTAHVSQDLRRSAVERERAGLEAQAVDQLVARVVAAGQLPPPGNEILVSYGFRPIS